MLSRSLNKLFDDTMFKGFGMPKWTDHLNHLAFTDDTIIFSSTDPNFLHKIMSLLGRYEQISGQQINKSKSSFYMHANIAQALMQEVENIT